MSRNLSCLPIRLLTAVLPVLAFVQPQAASAITVISSSAYGLFSDVRVASTVGVTVGPLAPASGQTPSGYNNSNTVLSADASVDLGAVALVTAGLDLSTGVLTSNASANGTLTCCATNGQGTATVNGLSLSLFTDTAITQPISIIGLTGDTLVSQSSVARVGNMAVIAGSSNFTNLDLNVAGLLNFSLGANASALPNTVLLDLLGLRIVLNEQLSTVTSDFDKSITTNAVHISFNDYLVGGRLLRGNVIVAHSEARIVVDPTDGIPPLPEPAVWMQLIAGFGLTGAVLRRRQRQAATA